MSDQCKHGRMHCIQCHMNPATELEKANATIAEQAKMIEHLRGGPTPLYTAVDMPNAARDGFRDGAASVVVELKVPASEAEKRWWVVLADCRDAIIAAGGRAK